MVGSEIGPAASTRTALGAAVAGKEASGVGASAAMAAAATGSSSGAALALSDDRRSFVEGVLTAMIAVGWGVAAAGVHGVPAGIVSAVLGAGLVAVSGAEAAV